MKKINLVLLICCMLFTAGCSLLPRLTFSKANVTPVEESKSERKVRCKGKITLNDQNQIIECEEGFYSDEENYNLEERKLTIAERLGNFIRGLAGWGFWLLIAGVVFLPGTVGLFIGRAIEGVFGLTGKALRSTVRAVQKARKEGKNIDSALAEEQDDVVKKKIRKIKEEEKLK